MKRYLFLTILFVIIFLSFAYAEEITFFEGDQGFVNFLFSEEGSDSTYVNINEPTLCTNIARMTIVGGTASSIEYGIADVV